MGLIFRRTKRLGRRTTVNLSKSGVSASRRAGRFTIGTRGRGSFRLGKGFSWRFKL